MLLALLLCADVARADEVRVEVHRDEDLLLVDVRAQRLFDEDLLEALRSGLPARVRMDLSLWAARSGMWDQLLLRQEIETRVVYHLLEDRYELVDDRGDVLHSDRRWSAIAALVEEVDDLPVCALDEVASDRRLYLEVRIELEPLSAEELRAMQTWLRGRGRDGRSDERSSVGGLSKRLLGVLKSQVGLDDRLRKGRSGTFVIEDLEDTR